MQIHCHLADLREPYRSQAAAQLAALATRRHGRQPQPYAGPALERSPRDPALLVDPGGPLLVRIIRIGGRTMDDDNLQAGYKGLRDAIAAALGRRGDSAAEGFTWEYQQRSGPEAGTLIEVYTEGRKSEKAP